MAPMQKPLKILLCGFVNHPNAQNINCSAIARYLDRAKFEVHAFYFSRMPLERAAFAGVTLRPVSTRRGLARLNPLRIFLRMLTGRYDAIYMPKGMDCDLLFARWFGKRKCLVSSMEGVITDSVSNDPERRGHFARMTAFFAISRCIQDSVQKYWGMTCDLLYLGHDCPVTGLPRESVKTVAYVGNIKENKRPLLFLECARAFPELRFLMIGDGEMLEDVRAYIHTYGLVNVALTGRISNQEVYQQLQQADLLLMTSRNEGLPKVMLEAASCAVPTVYINECYAVDYIEDGQTGYAVPDVDSMIATVRLLCHDSALFSRLSRNAQELSQQYHWSKLIGGYERFFDDAYRIWKKAEFPYV